MADARIIENEWLALADGTRLAARIWLPAGADGRDTVSGGLVAPAPAILEYLPYRKDDGTALADSMRHAYFAEHGFAAVRVDIRGTGDSDGILLDEYLAQEQDDALEVIDWIVRQPWCDGSVGMIGYSWGGFNGLQIAARRPPALKAVISGCSTDDRYLDDCHYQGGCMLGSDLLKWAAWMRGYNGLPPDPRFVGDRWREMWLDRLENTPHYVEPWLSHQRRDAFWKQGSIAEDYSAIEAAVFLFGGWADAYVNTIPRMLEQLECPRHGLVGPWGHMLPQVGVPGPAIGFLQECVAWFDRWLRGAPNRADEWPLLRAWMQEPAPPAPFYAERPGRWIAEDVLPPSSVTPLVLSPRSDGSLEARDPEGRTAATADETDATSESAAFRITGDQACGATQGVWCANGMHDELPIDQRPDDDLSLCFDTEPLPERVELLGSPRLHLELAADRPLAIVAARLCDVAPDGSSALITWGMLNLTHRESHEFPQPLEPGRRYQVTFELNAIGQAIEAGHLLRLALSPTYWPSSWPSPEPVELAVFPSEHTRLELPAREPQPRDSGLPPFGPPETATPLATIGEPTEERTRRVTHDPARATVEISDAELHDVRFADSGTRLREATADRWEITGDDPLSAHAYCERDFSLDRLGFEARIVSRSEMWSDATDFFVRDRLEAFEAGERIFDHTRELRIPRDLV